MAEFLKEKEKYVFRKNVGDNGAFPDAGAYFGCISEGEEPAGYTRTWYCYFS